MPPPEGDAPIEDQEKLLEEALKVVKKESFQMCRALDANKLMEGLKFASTMLSELRTSLLSPKAYYELYIAVSEELRKLESFLVDEFNKGHKVSDLYELVQYAGNIVPRLYLLVTVGAVYIKAKQVPTKDILKDLVEMCRGVQHPLRGLFLRNYLLQTIKRELPEEVSGDQHGSVADSIDFVLLNFSEMNKLWVRMQHQGHSRDKDRREQERRELRILVGTNLVRMSALENVTVAVYHDTILPAVLSQVVSCRDPIAQEYLLECIVQVFPDSFHLQTLAPFLDTCGQVHAQVNVKTIITALIDRLAAFALRDDAAAAIPKNLQLFDIFSARIAAVAAARPEMPAEDVVSLQLALANLARKCYPDRLDFIDNVLAFTGSYLTNAGLDTITRGAPVCKPLVMLLKLPVAEYASITTALGLAHFQPLFAHFSYAVRRELAVDITRDTLAKETHLETVEQVNAFFELVAPLVRDMDDQPADLLTDEDYPEEQHLIGRFLALIKGGTLDAHYQILSLARKALGAGGEHRIKFTLPTLVFQALQLVRAYHAAAADDGNWDKKVQKIFQFVHQSISALVKAEFIDLALRLFLQTALTADKTPFDKAESIAYECMSQAFQLYEEEISDSKAQIAAVRLIVAAFESMGIFGEENFTPLSTKCALVCSKLVNKPDQCRGVSFCSHVFWSGKQAREEKQDSKQTVQCLQRGLKVTSTLMEPAVQVQLYVEMLDKYCYYYEQGVQAVTVAHLNKICALIGDGLAALEAGEQTDTVRKYFANILTHIAFIKAHPPSEGINYADFQA